MGIQEELDVPEKNGFNKKKWLVITIFAMILVITASMVVYLKMNGQKTNNSYEEHPIKVLLDNQSINFQEVQPFIDDNMEVQVPAYIIAEKFGANFQWSPEKNQARFSNGAKTVVFHPGEDVVEVDGKAIRQISKAYNKDSAIYIPIRYFAELFGKKAVWDANANTIIIETLISNKEVTVNKTAPIPTENLYRQEITDIQNWKHPVKAVFQKYGIQLSKIVLTENKTYPDFNADISSYYNNKPLDSDPKKKLHDILLEIAQNNAFWSYSIKDDSNKTFISVECDKAHTKVTSISVNGSKTMFSDLNPLKIVEVPREGNLSTIEYKKAKTGFNKDIEGIVTGKIKYTNTLFRKYGLVENNSVYVTTKKVENIIDNIGTSSSLSDMIAAFGEPSFVEDSLYYYRFPHIYMASDGKGKIFIKYVKEQEKTDSEALKKLIEIMNSGVEYNERQNLLEKAGFMTRVRSKGITKVTYPGIELYTEGLSGPAHDAGITVYSNFTGKLFKDESGNSEYGITFIDKDIESVIISDTASFIKSVEQDFVNAKVSTNGTYKAILRSEYSDPAAAMMQYLIVRKTDGSVPDFMVYLVPIYSFTDDFRWDSDTEVSCVVDFPDNKRVSESVLKVYNSIKMPE